MGSPPLILFGAFDRHNLGDLLLAHVAARVCRRRRLRFAGLAERDLQPVDGHRVRAVGALARELGRAPVDLLHVGGELAGCSAFEAAVMLQSPEDAATAIARYRRAPGAGRAWAQARLGVAGRVPYLVPRALFAQPRRWLHAGLGGVDLVALPLPMRTEVTARLRESEGVWVRDVVTRAHLAAAGVDAWLAPDPAVQVGELFGERIARQRATPRLKAIAEACPQGYLALQFSARFADDATLATLAGQLAALHADWGCAVVAFCAGAAPWHDDPGALHRLRAMLGCANWFSISDSARLWELCALLAGARAYCGSSLHAGIVAAAFGRPWIALDPGGAAGGAKVRAYALSWPGEGAPLTAPPDGVADRFAAAQRLEPAVLRRRATGMTALARAAWDALAVEVP